ncbi:MAG: nucleoid-associated protein, partial [Blautia sp.]|nr:nucleoid-associated protein [Blautia sp.]
KNCSFTEESSVFPLVEEWNSENLLEVSQKIAEELYTLMNQNIDIPAADLLVVEYQVEQHSYLALLKMNYKTSYTHLTNSDPWGNNNDIIKQKAILPGETQKLTEAALIDLMAPQYVRLVEKKYDVNGVKTNYFSQNFLKCKGSLSSKTKLAIVNKAVTEVQKKYFHDSEQFEVQMETKSILNQEFSEQGGLEVPVVIDKIFKEHPQMKEEVQEKLEKYNLTEATIEPQNPLTTKKFTKQHLMTDTGIELKIPMEEYNNKDKIEFITNPDGTISVLIKNIGSIESK